MNTTGGLTKEIFVPGSKHPEQMSYLTWDGNSQTELLRFTHDGKILVRGVPAESDAQVVDAMREFLHGSAGFSLAEPCYRTAVPAQVTFANGWVLDLSNEPMLDQQQRGYVPIGLDQTQRELFTIIRNGIVRASTHDELRLVDSHFQTNKKRLPVVIMQALYSDMKAKHEQLNKKLMGPSPDGQPCSGCGEERMFVQVSQQPSYKHRTWECQKCSTIKSTYDK